MSAHSITPRLRVVIAGAGAIGRRHLDVLLALPEVSVVGVADPDPEARARVSDGGVTAYPTLSEALELQPDVVAVCAPNGRHAQLALEALEAGAHVVIEKPLSTATADGERVAEAAARAGRLATVVVQNRHAPAAAWLREQLVAGHLGRPVLVQVSALWNRDERYYTRGSWRGDSQLDGGVLFTQFSHFIDYLMWAMGPLEITSAELRNLTHPLLTLADTGTVQFRLSEGGLGALSFSTGVWGANLESRISVVGTRGAATLSGQYFDRLEACRIEGVTPPLFEPITDPLAGHRAVWAGVIEALLQGPPYPTTLPDALATVSAIERIHQMALAAELAAEPAPTR